MTEKNEIIVELTINTDKVLAETVRLKKEVKELADGVAVEKQAFDNLNESIKAKEAALKTLVTQEGEESKAVEEATNELAKLYNAIGDNTEALTKKQAELKATQQELRGYENVLGKSVEAEKEQTQALEEQIVTLDTLEARNAQLRLERKKLNINTKEGTAAITEINNEINANNELIIQHSDKVKKDKINVGNYTDSILNAKEAFGDFKGAISGGIEKMIAIQKEGGGLKAFWGAFVGGVNSANKSLLRLLLNPVGLFLAAIVVAIKQYQAVIESSEELTQFFAKAWAGVSSVFNTVIATVRDLYSALFSLFSGDFAAAWDKSSKAIGGFTDRIIDGVNAATKLADIEHQNEINARNRILQIANLTTELKKLELVENDNTKALKEQQEASILAGKKRLELAEIEKQAVDDAVKATLAEVESNNISQVFKTEAYKKHAEAVAAQTNAITHINEVRYQNEQKLREINSDNLQRELDALIDGFDVRKGLIEAELSDTTISIDKRKKAFAELQDDAAKNYQLEIDAINRFLKSSKEFAAAQIDATELIKMDQQQLSKYLTEKGIASDAISGSILMVYRERFMQLKDFRNQEKSFVAEQIEGQQKILNSQVNAINLELQIFIETQKKRKASGKAFTDDELKVEQEHIFALETARNNSAVAISENKKKQIELSILANKKESELTIEEQNKLNAELLAQDKQLNLELLNIENEAAASSKAIKDAKLAQDVEAELFLFDLKKELAQNNLFEQTRIAEEEVDLQAKKNKEIATKTISDQDKLAKAILDIDKVTAQKKKAIKIAEAETLLSINSQFLGTLRGAFAEHTKLYKALAIAQATVDTLSSAIAAYRSQAAIPVVGPALGAIAAAAALFTGYQNIKKITEVDTSGGSTSVGSAPSVSSPSPVSASATTGGQSGLTPNNEINTSIIQAQQSTLTKNDIKGAFSEALTEAPVRTAVVVDHVTNSQNNVATNNNLSVL